MYLLHLKNKRNKNSDTETVSKKEIFQSSSAGSSSKPKSAASALSTSAI